MPDQGARARPAICPRWPSDCFCDSVQECVSSAGRHQRTEPAMSDRPIYPVLESCGADWQEHHDNGCRWGNNITDECDQCKQWECDQWDAVEGDA